MILIPQLVNHCKIALKKETLGLKGFIHTYYNQAIHWMKHMSKWITKIICLLYLRNGTSASPAIGSRTISKQANFMLYHLNKLGNLAGQ